MTNVIIIEDEQSAYNHLKGILSTRYENKLDLLGTADNVKEAITLIETLKPELIFLDIELKDGVAFDILDYFSNNVSFEVIFTSGFIDYKERAMDYFAFYFLNKPIQKEQLEKVVNKYLAKKSAFNIDTYNIFKQQIESEKNTIALPSSNGNFTIINLDDLLYCEADGSYTTYYTSHNKKYISSNNLKKVEGLLSNSTFYRIHRSILLNLKHISKYNSNGKITLSNNKTLTVSTRNKKGFFKVLKLMNYIID